MNQSVRLWLVAVLALAVPVSVALLASPDPTLPPRSSDGGPAAAADRELDAKHRAVVARILEREEITAALVRGEVTLEQAAARFLDLNADPAVRDAVRQQHLARSDLEAAYRQVLGFVRGLAHEDPNRLRDLIARLEGEVARKFPPVSSGGLRGTSVPVGHTPVE